MIMRMRALYRDYLGGIVCLLKSKPAEYLAAAPLGIATSHLESSFHKCRQFLSKQLAV